MLFLDVLEAAEYFRKVTAPSVDDHKVLIPDALEPCSETDIGAFSEEREGFIRSRAKESCASEAHIRPCFSECKQHEKECHEGNYSKVQSGESKINFCKSEFLFLNLPPNNAKKKLIS